MVKIHKKIISNKQWQKPTKFHLPQPLLEKTQQKFKLYKKLTWKFGLKHDA